MADDKLSGKAGLDTTDFKTGISEMNRELRVLESGFRASAASLGDWSNDASGLESRIKSLNSQMDIQRQKVALTRAEYERIKAEKGETSRAAQDLEIKLNKETETLGKMETELRNTEGALNEMQTGTDEAGESVDELGDQTEETGEKLVTFQGVMDGVGQIAKTTVAIVAGLAAAVAGVALAIGGLVFNAAGTAAELVDLSTKTGISTTRLQELSFIGDQVGTSLDTITGAQSRLVRSMATAQEQNAKFNEELASGKAEDEINVGGLIIAFNKLGVSVEDSAGNLRNQQDVFDDTIDALGRIQNPAERDALAMEIFGKSAQELNPLIKAGSAEMNKLAKEAHDMGAVMDEDAVAGLEAFDDTMAAIQAGLKGTLGSLASEFLPVFQEVGTALKDLFASEEFKRGVREFSQILSGVVQTTVSVLRDLLSGNTKGALTTLFGAENATAIISFFDAVRKFLDETLIPFVTTHAPEIKAALIGIGAALAALGLIGLIAGIVAALNPVTLVIAAIVAAVGLLSAAWTGNWGGIRDTVTDVWEGFLKPIFQQFGEFLSVVIPAAIEIFRGNWNNLLTALKVVWTFWNNSLFPLMRAVNDFVAAVFGVTLRVLAGIWGNLLMPALRGVWQVLDNNLFPIFRSISDYISKTVQPILEKFGAFIRNTLAPAFTNISNAIASVVNWLKSMTSILNNLTLPSWLTPGSPTPWEIGLIGINKAMKDLNAQLPVLATQLNRSLPGAGNVPGLGGTVNSSTENNSFDIFGNVIIQGSTTPGSFAAGLKGRRY